MIASVKIRNFRTYGEVELDPDRVNICVGPNRAGKSSLRLALEMALTGRAAGVTDERGSGSEWLIRQGEREAQIAVTFADGKTLTRTLRRGAANRVTLTGVTGGTEAVEAALWARLRVGREELSVVLNGDRFLQLPAATQQAMLWRLSGWIYSPVSLRTALGGTVPEQALVATMADSLTGGAEVLDELEQRARTSRTGANRRVTELTADQARLGSGAALPQGILPDDRADLQLRFDGLSKARDLLQRRLGAVQSAIELARLDEEKLARLLAEQEKLTGVRDKDPGPRYNVERLRARKADADARLAEEQAALDQARATQVAAATELARLQAASRDGPTADTQTEGCCPFAPVRFACPVNASGAEACEAIQAALATAKTSAEQAYEELRGADGHVTGRRRELVGITTDLTEAERIATERAAAADRLPAIEKAIDQTRADHARHSAGADIAKLQSTIATLDTRLAKGRQILTTLDAAERAGEQAQQVATALKYAKDEATALDALVAALGPGGIKTRMLRELCDDLEQVANGYLSEMDVPPMRFDTHDRFAVEVNVAGGWAPPAVLSRSERMRLGAALAATFAGRIGLPLLVLDDADALGPDERAVLVDWLLGLPWVMADGPAGSAAIFVLAVRGEVEPLDPGVDGLAMWLVRGGQILRAPTMTEAMT